MERGSGTTACFFEFGRCYCAAEAFGTCVEETFLSDHPRATGVGVTLTPPELGPRPLHNHTPHTEMVRQGFLTASTLAFP